MSSMNKDRQKYVSFARHLHPSWSIRNVVRLNPAAGWDSHEYTWIYWTDSISGWEPRQTGRQTWSRGYHLSLPNTEWNEQSRYLSLGTIERGGVGRVKQGISNPDGLTVLNMLLLNVKAPWQARHSPSTSLMRAGLIKLGLKPLNEPSVSLVHVILS